ncbi:hypothetical protein LAC81_37020 (plasmid) [Ensifer adhaerens]|uniref:hypothetical protein n=1 Tax=Ensifer adhaerens TaxID=106592 RepID=UPI001CC12A01|nr:hypothetical protein [Ensifer adhaerens]MBZ7927541.1 hypothetical protein [Ensifer adhaerens]UAX97956.1 hypothetical protein LAC78_38325 [Ensifer adhaerens]UAY05335.1 hypothetical protein LAC80_37035 [Ensifer adhaerens]UAY12713.1 hypothetical protein LAC81_37020 [Ensifer adhaerens]
MSLTTGLSDRYPHLGFDERPLAVQCGAGWLGILHAFFVDADKAMATGGSFTLLEVRGKVGGLCIDLATADLAPEAHRAITDAQRLASLRSL